MADEVSLTIDDIEVAAARDATILEAASGAGIHIPHLCHNPALCLPPSSSCRLCLVEVEGARNLAAACSHPVMPGMVVHADTEELREIRRMVVDLLLSNHPHDCLTCERAGDCDLQKLAYELGVKEPEFAGEHVSVQPIQDGPAIVYDRSKCILCGRCVEVCHNVQVTGAVDFLERGFGTHIGLPIGTPREQSVCTECGNCIDVCPTGALSYIGAEGAGRAWELKRVPTICPYCGCGCTLMLHVRDNRVVKITGEPGQGVSRGLLCVKGHFGLDFLQHKERLTQPLIRRNGELKPAAWNEALDLVAERLSEIKKASGADSIAGLSSAKCSNEENYIMQKFMRAAVGTNNVDHCARLCHASTVAGLARAFGSGAMTNSIEDFDKADAIFVIGSNTTECHPIIGSAIKRAAFHRNVPLIVADPRAIELTEYAAVHLQQKSGADVALINAMMHVILKEGLEDKAFIKERTEGFEELRNAVEPCTPELAEKITGVPADDIRRAARIYAKAPAASIVYSMGITQHTTGTDNVLSLANLAMLTGNVGKPGAGVNPLRGQSNVQGACDLGALPNVYPGYQKVDDDEVRAKFEAAWGVGLSPTPGLTVVEIMHAAAEGKIKALYVMGENPMLSDPNITHVEEALKALDFLIVQDIFLTETARLADVVLPAAAFAEKDGTITNTERRVQRLHAAVEAPGEARPDWQITCDLARRMGYEMSYPDASAIQDEIAGLTPIYGGITYDRLEAGGRGSGVGDRGSGIRIQPADPRPPAPGIQWPCPDSDHPGTPYLHKGKFSRGLGKFHPVEFIPANELPDEEYPLILTTGRRLQHFHTGTMSRRSRVLDELVPHGEVEIHPSDAARLGVENGETVRVTTRRGAIETPANVTERIAEGTIFIAFHFAEAPANRLTNDALDPIAKIPEFKICAARVRKASEPAAPRRRVRKRHRPAC